MSLTPEQWEEVNKGFAANRAVQAALNKKRRMESGELEIELEGGPDDLPVNDSAFQAELNTFSGALHQAAVPYSQSAIAFDSVDAHGYPLAEFAIQLLNSPAIGVVCTAIGIWLKGRYGRKVHLKFGDVEAEARTPEEVEQLLKSVAAFRDSLGKAEKEK
jgi:hypothetical protein